MVCWLFEPTRVNRVLYFWRGATNTCKWHYLVRHNVYSRERGWCVTEAKVNKNTFEPDVCNCFQGSLAWSSPTSSLALTWHVCAQVLTYCVCAHPKTSWPVKKLTPPRRHRRRRRRHCRLLRGFNRWVSSCCSEPIGTADARHFWVFYLIASWPSSGWMLQLKGQA